MVDFGSEQGLSTFETGGAVLLRRSLTGSENAALGQKMPIQPIGDRPQVVAFGSEQGLSTFETGGAVLLRRGFQKSENAALGQKMPLVGGHPPIG